jgi:tetratricopeptide (TPR) repeat protein
MLAFVIALAATVVVPGRSVQQTLAPGRVCVLQIVVDRGQLVRAEVEQGENDLSVAVVAPDNRRTFHDQRDLGVDYVSFIGQETGTYQLEIRAVGRQTRPVTFTIRIARLRTATESDDALLDAEQMTTAAKQLLDSRDRADLQQAVERHQELVASWQALGHRDMAAAMFAGAGEGLFRLNRYSEAQRSMEQALAATADPEGALAAEIRNNLGLAHLRQGDLQAARATFEHALGQWRSLSLRQGESLSLSNLGIVLRQSGEYDEARRSYLRALRLAQQRQDRHTEGLVLSNLGIVVEAMGNQREAVGYLQRAAVRLAGAGDDAASGRSVLAIARIQLGLGERVRARANE